MKYLITTVILAALSVASGCQGLRTIHYRFDSDEGLEFEKGDEGLAIGVENGELRVWGETTDTGWSGDGVLVPVEDRGGALEASGEFRLAKRESSGLVFLGVEAEEAGHMILIFEWHPRKNVYWIQRAYLGVGSELTKGRRRVPAFGNEDDEFNSLRIRVRNNRKDVDFYVNDVLIDTLRLEEKVGRIFRARLEFQTPRDGKEYDIRFDELTIKSDTPRTD